jgi:hypothetical protein
MPYLPNKWVAAAWGKVVALIWGLPLKIWVAKKIEATTQMKR